MIKKTRRYELIYSVSVPGKPPKNDRLDFELASDYKPIPENAVIVDRELLEKLLKPYKTRIECENCAVEAECREMSYAPCFDVMLKELQRRAGR